MKQLAAATALALAAVPAAAKWSVQVQTLPSIREVKTVAVAPITGATEGFDYLTVERDLAELLAKHFRVVSADAVRQKAFELKIELPSEGRGAELLEALGADAIAETGNANTSSHLEGPDRAVVSSGPGFAVATSGRRVVKQGRVDLRIVDRDHNVVLQGSGMGESRNPSRSPVGMITKIHRLILERAFEGPAQ